MFDSLPTTVELFMRWPWSRIAPYYDALAKRPLTPDTVANWLADWTRLTNLIGETYSRLHVATTVDTTDADAEAQRNQFLENIYPEAQKADQILKQQLLESGLSVPGMERPLRKMRVEAELFREENLPLQTKEIQLSSQYNKMIGAQTVEWDGETRTLTQMKALFQTPDREMRRVIWLMTSARQLADREALNGLWQQLLDVRRRIAANAGYDSYLQYRWKYLKRFDYTPADSVRFHEAIETAVVPAASRVYERARQRLSVAQLHPWDVLTDVFPLQFPALHPVEDLAQLDSVAATMFHRVDPALGAYFDTMQAESLLDLPNRTGKAPGGYCTYFATAKRPFIFMNAVGTADDVKTILHEAGHAFHTFEAADLPYNQQRHPGHEFSEVASMSMELLAAPYLAADAGGYYVDPADAARHRISHLEKIITFWPYMAVVDGFQHWVYENMDAAADPANCDAAWRELWQRFIPAIDWTDYDDELVTGWHRKQHIFRSPFYYVEYGMAQVGAIQVWRNALADQPQAIRQYREALALGGTRSLPDLYAAAGAQFRFDTPTMQQTVDLLEETIDTLMTQI